MCCCLNQVDIEGAELLLLNGSAFDWLRDVRFLFMEGHPRSGSAFGVTGKPRYLQTLLESGMHVLTLPDWEHPSNARNHEYIYFACGHRVPLATCLRVCNDWQQRRKVQYVCDQVADKDDFTGLRGRAQRLGDSFEVLDKEFRAKFHWY